MSKQSDQPSGNIESTNVRQDNMPVDPAAQTAQDEEAAARQKAAEDTAAREAKATEARTKANEAAYAASIEGQELPPSVQEEQAAAKKA